MVSPCAYGRNVFLDTNLLAESFFRVWVLAATTLPFWLVIRRSVKGWLSGSQLKRFACAVIRKQTVLQNQMAPYLGFVVEMQVQLCCPS